jgi:CIC family chloride channel protein
MILLAGAVGIVAGLGAIAFQWCTQFVSHYALDFIAGYKQHGPTGEKELFESFNKNMVPLLLVIVPTIGGLISGFIVFTFAPEAEGHGTDAAIDAYHNKRGIIRPQVPFIKMITSAITLGTGGSGGREGPIALIGAGFGSFLATRLKLSDYDRRILLAVGVGAGIGAIFRAPLAGAIFATEVLYRDPDFESEALIPAFIATTAAYCVFGLVFGFTHLFSVQAVAFNNPMLLLPLAVLAVVMALASLLYVRTFYGVNKLFKRFRIPRHIKPAIGAFATGLFAVTLYYCTSSLGSHAQKSSLSVLSFGYGFLQEVLNPSEGAPLLISVLLIVGIGKIITTSLTIGSGGSGGVFGPSMVIGGSLGAVVGLLFQQWMPNVVGPNDVVIFVILGMASFFAAAANTPVSTLIMVSEMTASYALLLPSMWVCALSYLVSRNWTIYREQVGCRIDSPAHRGDFIFDILEGITVRETRKIAAPKPITIPIDMLLKDVVRLITDTTQTCFPVVDRNDRFYGLFSLNDIRAFLYDNEAGELAIAQDLTNTRIKPLMLDMDLSMAMGIFARINLEELPVVDPEHPETIIGMLRRQDIISVYNARLIKLRATEAE